MILRLVGFFLVLGVIIFVHELGHYLVARLSKVRVEEFGMGYPPRIVKLFKFQGTDFTLNWIPFGGFARLKGMDEEDPGIDSFVSAPSTRKVAILVAGSLMNLLLAFCCFSLTYRVGVPIATGLPELTEVPSGSVAAGFSMVPGDIILTVNGVEAQVSPFLTQVRLRKPIEEEPPNGQLALLREGEIMRLSVSAEETLDTILAGSEYRAVLNTQISRVIPDSPAEAVGLQVGDRVYSLAGVPFYLDSEDLVDVTHRNLGEEVTLVVLREGTHLETSYVTPRLSPPSGEGPLGVTIRSISKIGFVGTPYFLALGVADTLAYMQALATLPAQIFSGQVDAPDTALIGPVGIASLVGDAVEVTTSTGLWLPVLRLTGALSSALAVINLLPIPALDGGRLLFVLVEMVRRKPIEPSREKMVHVVGMVLLLMMMVFITIQDVTSPQEGIDWYAVLGQ